ncbi:MAG: hypothetical protein JXR25_12080 [Pontiellaceae bacterium]|nr:hypothetical protein [Pontiellaceae bacterium]MBN2785552.1 hypothetical protein [Pontiellaceae bacterium]
MKSQTKALMILAATATLTMGARADEQEQTGQPAEKPMEFKCPTCGSPCINKAELIRYQRINMSNNPRQRPENAQPPALRQRVAAQAQRQEIPAQARIPDQVRQAMKERAMKFDIDGDGELSQPERAAMRQQIQARAMREGAPTRNTLEERAPADAPIRQAIKERAMKFDIDGDGELSQPERAAMRAYRSALREARADAPESRPAAQPEVTE